MPKREKQTAPEKEVESEHTESTPQGNGNSRIVRLNVGGTRYEVSRNTLMRLEGSMLAILISGQWREGDVEDEIFIDRDGNRFKYILDYLRSDWVYVSDLSDQAALKDDFEFFGINADMSKVSVMGDFTAINELSEDIEKCEKTILEKKRKIAAIQESYRLANVFSKAASIGLFLQLDIVKDVDKELCCVVICYLADCMLFLTKSLIQTNTWLMYAPLEGKTNTCQTRVLDTSNT